MMLLNCSRRNKTYVGTGVLRASRKNICLARAEMVKGEYLSRYMQVGR